MSGQIHRSFGILKSVLLAAIPAGLAAGAVLTVVQTVLVLPLIHEAERLEFQARDAAETVARSGQSVQSGQTGTTAQPPAPEPHQPTTTLGRTLISNLLLGIAFGLLLCAAMLLGEARGAGRGLLWGLAGFVAFSLAPALSVAPELPGAPLAEGLLVPRQLFWWSTAGLTAGGLYLVLRSGRLGWRVAGCGLLVLPHLIPLPGPGAVQGGAPAELAEAFGSVSLVANFGFWCVLGIAVGALRERGASRE